MIPSIRQNASVWGFEYAGGWNSLSFTFWFDEGDLGGGAVCTKVSTSLMGSACDGLLSVSNVNTFQQWRKGKKKERTHAYSEGFRQPIARRLRRLSGLHLPLGMEIGGIEWRKIH